MGIFGMVGIDILEKPGVAGDLREDSEDIEATSVMLEFFREPPPDVVEDALSLRENNPIFAVFKSGRRALRFLNKFVIVTFNR